MFRYLFTSLMLCLELCVPLFCGTSVSTKINKVIVYQPAFPIGREIVGSALIKRTAQIYPSFNKKFEEFEIVLPEKLDMIAIDTLRVDVEDGGKLLSVKYEVIYSNKANIEELQTQLHKLEDNLSIVEGYIKAVEEEQKLIQTLRLSSDNNLPSPDEISSILDIVEEKWKKTIDFKVALLRKRQNLVEEIRKIKEKMSEVNSLDKRRYKVVISVSPYENTKRMDISISYLVRGVSWIPEYKITFDGKNSTEVEMMAAISQYTGVDWDNVKLVLSSGKSYSLSHLPDVMSLRVKFVEDSFGQKLRYKLARSTEALSVASDKMEDATENWSDVSEKRVISDVVEYVLDGVSVPSGDKAAFVRIEKWNMEVDEFYYAVLQNSSCVYWVLELKKDTRFINGMKVSVFVGNSLVNKSRIQLNKIWFKKDRWLLVLGEAEFVSVKKTEIENKKDELLFGKINSPTITQHYSYKISIENRGDRKILLRVVDAIPVSVTDKIKVKDIKLKPKPSIKEFLGRKGVYMWELRLDAHSGKTIEESFSIAYPSKKKIEVVLR